MRASTFTTYINAETDPGLEQAWARNTKLATASYGTITQAAQAATRATAGLVGGNRSTAGIQNVNRALGQQAQTLRQVTTAAANQERQSARVTQSSQREAEATRRLANQHRGLAQSLNTTATAFSVVEGRMSPLAGRFITISRAAEQLTGLQLGLAGVGASIFALGRAGNQYQVLASRLRPFYDSQQDANKAMADVIRIAERSRSALEPVVEIYARLKSQTDQLGISQSRIGRITEIASKAATLSGGTRQAREGALVQFSQAFGANFRGAGQEFASLQEGAPVLLKAIADGYKNLDGSIGTTIGNLRKLGAEGKLTAADVADALDRSAARINEMFANAPKTLGVAATEFSNAITVSAGRLDESLKLTSSLAQVISTVAENMRAVEALVVGTAVAFGTIKLSGLAAGVAGTVRQTLIMQAAVTELGRRRAANAAASQAQHTREVAALEAEQIQIRENIALLERQRAVAARDVARNQPSAGFAGSSRRVTAATLEERAAVRGLIQERQRLGIINNALTAANGRLAASTTASAAATSAMAARTSLAGRAVGGLMTAGRGLVSFLGGPWAIAFTVATTAVYLLATAQSAAERSADRLAKAQEDLGRFVDSTTGKIKAQSVALRENAINDSDKRVRESTNDYLLARSNAANYRVLSNDPAVRAIQDRYGSGGSAGDATRQLVALRNRQPGLTSQINPIIQYLAQAVTSAQEGVAQRAANRQLRGKGTAFDARVVEEGGNLLAASASFRDQTGGTGTARTKAQINAEAAARAAQTDVQRAQANLAKIRAQGKEATETEDAYIDRLAAAQMAVRSAQEAEKSLRSQRSAGAAAARKEARDAIQDAKDEAAAKRDAALLDLEKNKATLTQGQYLEQRIAILKTYDDEVNKLDASAAASSRAASQLIADAKKVAEAASAAADKRRDILAGYDDAPRAVDKASKDIGTLRDFIDTAVDGVAFIGKTKEEIEEISKLNPLGTGIYTEEMAAADEANINKGLRKPMEDIRKEADRNLEIARLQLVGADAEAEALSRIYSLVDRIGSVREEDYDEILGIVRQEQRINDLLSSRQRITSLIQGTVDATRDSFEEFITSIPDGAGKAGANFFKALRDNALKIQARKITEAVFAGADEKVRAALTGKANVEGALRQYISTLNKTESGTDKLASAMERAAQRIDDASKAIAAAGDKSGVSAGAQAVSVADTIAGTSTVAGAITSASTKAATQAVNDNQTNEIVVTAEKSIKTATQTLQSAKTPTVRETYAAIGKGLGSKVDDALHGLFGSGKKNADGTFDASSGGFLGLGNTSFFGKLGDAVGKGVSGAATGAMVGGVMKSLGIKTSQTGAQIGGAIGSLTGIPGLDIAGSIAGGLIGGLFKKNRSAGATITGLGAATLGGKDSKKYDVASGLAGSVQDQLSSIADTLGGDVGSFNITIGTRGKEYRVNSTGSTSLKGKNGAKGFKDEQEAIAYALSEAISQGAIQGISAASQKILKSGQDLQKALEKASVIESIPKRLLQLTDPVRYAVNELNDEFEKMIEYLKEGGATAEQFADAQKLYELERAKAIEEASQQASKAIQDFLNDMTGGSSSPYSKRTTYNNAAQQLDAFKADIAAGKTVDQDELLTASRNFQDASRALYGSSASFFEDFEMLRSLLSKARDNAGTSTDVTTLPASPFTDSSVQDALKGLAASQATTQAEQTDRIVDSLGDIVTTLLNLKGSTAASTSSPLASLGF